MISAKAVFLYVVALASDYNDNINNINVEQAFCLASNIYHESRGEPEPGMYAVAHITMNRVNDKRFPATICNVVKAHSKKRPGNPHLPAIDSCHFSWYCAKTPQTINLSTASGELIVPDFDAFIQASTITLEVLLGLVPDNTHGSNHYYNDKLANPYWAKYYTPTVKIGQHVFLRREHGSMY